MLTLWLCDAYDTAFWEGFKWWCNGIMQASDAPSGPSHRKNNNKNNKKHSYENYLKIVIIRQLQEYAKNIDKTHYKCTYNYTVRISKNWRHDFASWLLRFRTLRTALTVCTLLSWLPLRLRSEMMDPCFVHCHIPTQEILFIASKQWQTALWIVDSLLLLFHCEQTRHPFGKDLFHAQFFV